jgi:hypothetical protein
MTTSPEPGAPLPPPPGIGRTAIGIARIRAAVRGAR